MGKESPEEFLKAVLFFRGRGSSSSLTGVKTPERSAMTIYLAVIATMIVVSAYRG